MGETSAMTRWQRFGLVGAIAVLLLLLWQGPLHSQSVSNLQSEVWSLRREVSQLQAEVARLSRQPLPNTGAGPVTSTPPRSPIIGDRQMFDRLAILAIEAKDRLNALEARVGQLEQRLKS